MNTLIPKISEKSFFLSESQGTYVFAVPKGMNKLQVAKALKLQYEVDAEDVRIAVVKGKAVRFIRKGGRMNKGQRHDVRKAYIRLAEGQTLPIFAALTEEEKNSDKKAPKKGVK